MQSMKGNPALRPADAGELQLFYRWMEAQFHAGELKPLELIERLAAEGRYAAYGLWDADELIAYALFGIAEDGRRRQRF